MKIVSGIFCLCTLTFILISIPYPKSGNYTIISENNNTYCAPSYNNYKGDTIYCSIRRPAGYCPLMSQVYIWIYNKDCHYQEYYIDKSKMLLIGIGTILFAIVLSSLILYILYSLIKEGIIGLVCSGLYNIFCGVNSLFLKCFCRSSKAILPV